MKSIAKALKWFFILLLVVVVGLLVFIQISFPKKFEAPYPAIHASKDSAVIARGKYIVYGIAHCAECHAPLTEFNKVETGQEVPLSGGHDFFLPVGVIHSPNITSDEETGIGKLKDEEIARALRYGVRHDGNAILDFMPFYHLSDEDLTAVVSYLRTIPPVKNKVPDHDWNFLGKAIGTFMIKPMGDGKIEPAPAVDTTIAYGKYIGENVANCRGCHTIRDMKTGAFTGTYYTGGMQFEMASAEGTVVKGKHLVTPNLTPDPETGRITGWSQQQFVDRFKQGRLIPGSIMPWGPFSRMTNTELVAIYKYLRTLEPIKNETPAGVQEGDPVQ
jgi:mono/diheme cytochrome c family protein